MPATSYDLHGIHVFACAPDGKKLRTGRDATDLMSEASGHDAALLLIPVERLDEDFFLLRTGIAGEIVQKFVQYGARVAIVGDISQHMNEGSSFRAFAIESNRGAHCWFVPSVEELGKRLEHVSTQAKI